MTEEERELEYKRIAIELENLTEEEKKKLNSKENYVITEWDGVIKKIYFDGTEEIIQPSLKNR
mgnify:CR=1 FL=1